MAYVQHKRGTRAALDTLKAANGLLVGQIYFVTDENKLVVGTSVNTYAEVSKSLAIADTTNLQTTLDGKQNRHGFENRTASTLSFTNATRTFTITGTNFKVWNDGVLQTKNTESIQIPATSAAYFIYYNSSNVLTQSTTAWTIGTDMPIAMVLWNGSEGLIAEERHGSFDTQTHKYLHSVMHTMYASGLAGTFGDTTFSVSAGTIFDEDIEISIPTTTSARIFYRNGTSLTWTSQQANYNLISGTMQYDNAGTLTAVTSNNYIAIWCYATDLVSNGIVFVLGQRQDINIANARANNTPAGLDTSFLPLPEMKLLYRIIVKNDATPYEEITDYRLTSVTGASYGVIDHQTLTNRSAVDSHPISAITDLQTTLDAKLTYDYQTSHFVVSGTVAVPSGDTDYICPIIVDLAGFTTGTLKRIRYRINGGTSATIKLTKNGTDVTGYTSLSCTTTTSETASDVSVANNDVLALVVTAVSGTPKNLTCLVSIKRDK